MKVLNEKGVAKPLDPESYGARREARVEALTGEPVGCGIEPRKGRIPGAEGLDPSEGNIHGAVIANRQRGTRRGPRSDHAGKTLAREPGDLGVANGDGPLAREANP